MSRLFTEEQEAQLREITQRALNCLQFAFEELEDYADRVTPKVQTPSAYVGNLTEVIKTSVSFLERARNLLSDAQSGDDEMLDRLQKLADQLVPRRGE